MTQMTPILVRMPPELLAQIDAKRGDVGRALFIRRCCERAVGAPQPVCTRYPGVEIAGELEDMVGVDREPVLDNKSRRMKAGLDAMRVKPVDVRRAAVLDLAAIHAEQAEKIAAEPGGRTIPGVQLGPTKREAGSMLKKLKK